MPLRQGINQLSLTFQSKRYALYIVHVDDLRIGPCKYMSHIDTYVFNAKTLTEIIRDKQTMNEYIRMNQQSKTLDSNNQTANKLNVLPLSSRQNDLLSCTWKGSNACST